MTDRKSGNQSNQGGQSAGQRVKQQATSRSSRAAAKTKEFGPAEPESANQSQQRGTSSRPGNSNESGTSGSTRRDGFAQAPRRSA
jgi:hypothetical protein